MRGEQLKTAELYGKWERVEGNNNTVRLRGVP